jgi:hypothetical protein
MDTESESEDLQHGVESISKLFQKLASKEIDALQRFFFKFKTTILTERPPDDEEGANPAVYGRVSASCLYYGADSRL